jgi:hypothetical protein
MLGSSRTVNALKAKELEAQLAREAGVPVWAFNFGTLGAGPLTELLNLKRLLREGIHPDLLLVEVFPAVLAGQESVAHAELYRFPVTRLWYRELALMRSYGYPAPELRHDWWEGCLVPWYTQRFCIVSWAAPATLPWNLRQDWFREVDDSGWVEPPQLQREAGLYQQAVARARAEYAPYLTGFRLGGPSCRALRELLDVCRHEHVATALVLMPEGSPFRSWYPADALKATDRFLRQLRQEYGIAVIDARQWIPDEDFIDSHHLLPEGAALFTERLGRTALLPLLSPSALGMHGEQ